MMESDRRRMDAEGDAAFLTSGGCATEKQATTVDRSANGGQAWPRRTDVCGPARVSAVTVLTRGPARRGAAAPTCVCRQKRAEFVASIEFSRAFLDRDERGRLGALSVQSGAFAVAGEERRRGRRDGGGRGGGRQEPRRCARGRPLLPHRPHRQRLGGRRKGQRCGPFNMNSGAHVADAAPGWRGGGGKRSGAEREPTRRPLRDGYEAKEKTKKMGAWSTLVGIVAGVSRSTCVRTGGTPRGDGAPPTRPTEPAQKLNRGAHSDYRSCVGGFGSATVPEPRLCLPCSLNEWVGPTHV